MAAYSLDDARRTYSLPYWSEGYFDVGNDGRLVVRPDRTAGREIALSQVVDQAREQGLKLPLLVRFADILGDKLGRMQAAFAKAMADLDYDGGYTAVYPIKVNQHLSVAGELVARADASKSPGPAGFGLEAGSKPELIAVLALSRGGIVICNGYKDREYIRLALIGRKLGLDVFIVIEKPSELDTVLEEAAALGVEPLLGARLRLASLGAGKWQNTGGDKAKFGLSPRQLLDLGERLRAAGKLDALKLLHFHMGSQISNLRDIAGGMREATRYMTELGRLGAAIRYMDVGGGLGIDYEGTRSRSYCSINYSLDQYASTVVEAIAEACRAEGMAMPHVITEAGRAMTAHHAVLIAGVSEVETAPLGGTPAVRAGENAVIGHLRDIVADFDARPPLELYHEAVHYLAEGQARYAQGDLGIEDRAVLDDLFYAIAHGVRRRLKTEERAHRQVLDDLNDKLVDKYFVNFSVFQSIPDVWAIDQVFPIVPISRLDECPDRHGVIADLTCDSDGRIDLYVDSEGVDSSLPLHALREGEAYRLGFFLVGAYQETLGDIHNLFGDTDSVDVILDGDDFRLRQPRRGDSADRLLGYVGYDVNDLRRMFTRKLDRAGLDANERALLHGQLEAGLTAYTYLDETG
jgi:arginine decarboxylase